MLSLAGAPTQLKRIGQRDLAARGALALLDTDQLPEQARSRAHAQLQRCLASQSARAPLEEQALEALLGPWFAEQTGSLQHLPLRLTVVTGAESDDGDTPQLMVAIGLRNREHFGEEFVMRPVWHALERTWPGLAGFALHTLDRQPFAAILTPATALGMYSRSHWMGEVDETFLLEDNLDSLRGETDTPLPENVEDLTPAQRRTLCGVLEILSRAEFDAALPRYLTGPKALPRRVLRAPARKATPRARQIAAHLEALLRAHTVAIRAARRHPWLSRSYMIERVEAEAAAHLAVLQWSNAQDTDIVQLADRYYGDLMEGGTDPVAYSHWWNLAPEQLPGWMHHFTHVELPGLRAVDALLPLLGRPCTEDR